MQRRSPEEIPAGVCVCVYLAGWGCVASLEGREPLSDVLVSSWKQPADMPRCDLAWWGRLWSGTVESLPSAPHGPGLSARFRNSILPSAEAAAKLLQLCPTLCNPRDGSPLGSHIPGILQARTLEWVAISFSNA